MQVIEIKQTAISNLLDKSHEWFWLKNKLLYRHKFNARGKPSPSKVLIPSLDILVKRSTH